MSLDEQAKQVRDKADLIQTVARQMIDLCDDILRKRQIGTETIEYSKMQKQKMFQQCQQLKAQLQSLVEELP